MSAYSPEKFSFNKKHTGKMPAGCYVVIDPSYVLGKDPFWSEFYSFFSKDNKYVNPVWVTIGHHTFPIFSTAYGDGCYPVLDHGEFIDRASVDAGFLSLIPGGLVYVEEADLGVSVNLTKKFRPQFPERGVAIFDYIEIDTRPVEDEEE